MGLLRSATASDHLNSKGWTTDYCGTDQEAVRKPSRELMEWADKIICFQMINRSRLRRQFKGFSKKMQVWDIEDEHSYMCPRLIKEVERRAPGLRLP